MNTTSQVWLLARSSGLVAYMLLTLGVVAGLTLKTRMLGRAVSPVMITAVHQLLSTVGIVAVAVHAAMIVIDTKVDVPLIATVIPGLSGYRPVATAVGVIAFELWIIIHASFALRQRIGIKRWRSLHRLTLVAWAMAAIHGLSAGSDSSLAWVQYMYAGTIGIVLGLFAWRMLTVTPKPAPRVNPKTPHIPSPQHTPTRRAHDERAIHNPVESIPLQRHG